MNCCWRNISAKKAARLSSKEEIRLVSLEESYQQTPPPPGYPSWEDLCRHLKLMTAKADAMLSELKRAVDDPNNAAIDRHEKDIAAAKTALAAAKKEAGR